MICSSLIIGFHLATYHFNREAVYQEINPGPYVECDGWQVGAYYNSYKSPAVYVAKKYSYSFVDLQFGVVAGYKQHPIMPLIVPSVKTWNVRWSLLIPTKANTGGIHMSYEF